MLVKKLYRLSELIINEVDIETGKMLGEFLFMLKDSSRKIVEEFVVEKKIPIGNLCPLIYWDCISSDRKLSKYLNNVEINSLERDRMELYLYLFKYIERLSLINQMYLLPVVNKKKIDFDNLSISNVGEHFVSYAVGVLNDLIKQFNRLKNVNDFFKIVFNDKHDINWIKLFAFSGGLHEYDFYNLMTEAMTSYTSIEDLYNQKTYEELECYLSPNHCALAFALMRLKYKDDIYIVMS